MNFPSSRAPIRDNGNGNGRTGVEAMYDLPPHRPAKSAPEKRPRVPAWLVAIVTTLIPSLLSAALVGLVAWGAMGANDRTQDEKLRDMKTQVEATAKAQTDSEKQQAGFQATVTTKLEGIESAVGKMGAAIERIESRRR